MPAGQYGPLALFLGTAALAGAKQIGALPSAAALALAYVLVFQFRLWDDLNDRDRDRERHPERVLVQAVSLAPFNALLLCLFGLNLLGIAWLSDGGAATLAFVLLNAIYLVWYRWRRDDLDPTLSAHVVLIKYPAFVYLLNTALAPIDPVPLSLSTLTVFLCFAIYEILHDADLRSRPEADRVLAIEMAALTGVAALMAVALRPHHGTASFIQWAWVPVTAVVSAVLYRRYRSRSNLSRSGRAVFVVGFAAVINFAVGLR